MSSLLHSVFPRRARGESDLSEFQAREEGRSSSNFNDTPLPSPVESGELSSNPSFASSRPPDNRVHDSTGSRSRNETRDVETGPMWEAPEAAAMPNYISDKPPRLPSKTSAESATNVVPKLSGEEAPLPSSSSSSHKRARRAKKSKHSPAIDSKTDNLSLNLNQMSRLKKLNPSLVLENSGSVARDHLASERTFLAYVRTSLALASMGVAIVQLFTIADIASPATGTPTSDSSRRVQNFARPLGITAVLLALVVLGIAVYRYFLVQHALPEKIFPVARFSIAFISFLLGAVVVVIFAALLGGRLNG